MIDSLGIRDAMLALPEQIEASMGEIGDIAGLPEPEGIDHVLVLGMGDSGFGGDLAAASARPFSPIPIVVYSGYLPPSWVGPTTLVIAMSSSGATEETLESLETAIDSGAALVAVTNGGELESLARRSGSPVLPVVMEGPMPRASLGSLAVPPMLALEQIGLFPGARVWLSDAVAQLTARRAELVGPDSPAREIAERLAGTVPVVYGGGAIGTTAAKRWKIAFNHNAKTPAFWAPMPELCHNELVGWSGSHHAPSLFSQVHLRHEAEHPQTARRFDWVRDRTRSAVADVIVFEAAGEGPVANLLDLVLVGDLTSLEMAAAADVDPGPLPVVDDLKDWLDA